MAAGREGRLREVRRLQAARRARLGPGRRQGGHRPRRMGRAARRADRGERADRGRDRHDRGRRLDLLPLLLADKGISSRPQHARRPVRPPLQHAATPFDDASAPRRLLRSSQKDSSRRRSAIPNTSRSARTCSAAARRFDRDGLDDMLDGNSPSQGAAEGGGLRRHADRDHAVDRHRVAHLAILRRRSRSR